MLVEPDPAMADALGDLHLPGRIDHGAAADRARTAERDQIDKKPFFHIYTPFSRIPQGLMDRIPVAWWIKGLVLAPVPALRPETDPPAHAFK